MVQKRWVVVAERLAWSNVPPRVVSAEHHVLVYVWRSPDWLAARFFRFVSRVLCGLCSAYMPRECRQTGRHANREREEIVDLRAKFVSEFAS